MFYYLLNHSSLLNKQNEKTKNLSIILFGSLVYLAIHAFLSFNKNTSIQKVKPYFWFMFLLDIVMSYYSFIYKSKDDNDNESQDNKKEHNFMEEIFSIKNKISNMISSNKNESYQQENNNDKNRKEKKEKTDLQKEKDELILQLKNELSNTNTNTNTTTNTTTTTTNNNTNNNNKENIQISDITEDLIKDKPIKSSKKLSTPIKNLKKNKPKIQQQRSQVNDIKEKVSKEEEDKIENTNKEENYFNDSASESGSEMDFDISEFQNSLDE